MTVVPAAGFSIRWIPPTKEWSGRDPKSVHSGRSILRAWEVARGPRVRPVPDETNPAISAAIRGDVAALRVLMHRDRAALEKLLEMPDASGNTALIWAADRNQVEVLEYLLGPEVLCCSSSPDASEGTPPPVDLFRRGYQGNTALFRAVRHNSVAVVKLLLDAIDRFAEGQGGMTTTAAALAGMCNDKLQYPMHVAAFNARMEALDVLLSRGCDSFVVDRKGRTPLEDTASPEVKERILNARQALKLESRVAEQE